jgi:hypothetical protein
MRAVGIILIALGMLVGGCFGGGSATPAPVVLAPMIECVGIPERTCQEIVTEARRNAEPGSVPLSIKAACSSPQCTIQNGEVDIEVAYSNGVTSAWGMGWAGAEEPGVAPDPGAPIVPGEPVCLGVPALTCRELAESSSGADPQGREVASITVRCRAVPCTTTTGSGDTLIEFVDGTSVVTEWSYENATPSS